MLCFVTAFLTGDDNLLASAGAGLMHACRNDLLTDLSQHSQFSKVASSILIFIAKINEASRKKRAPNILSPSQYLINVATVASE